MKKLISMILAGVLAVTLLACNAPARPSVLPAVNAQLTVSTQTAEELYNSYVNDLASIPVRFTIGTSGYTGFGKDFTVKSRVRHLTDGKRTDDIRLTHTSGLTVELAMAFYPDHDAYEWTVWFVNETESTSPIVANVYGSDFTVKGASPRLRGIRGDVNGAYAPYDIDLNAEDVIFDSTSGRPSDDTFPYYDLAFGNGGLMMALGWPGTWRATFEHAATDTVRYKATTSTGLATKLYPGERIRTALHAFVRYEGTQDDATNAWRRWYIDHNMPTERDGTTLKPMVTLATFNDYTASGTIGHDVSPYETAVSMKRSLQAAYDNGVQFDYHWIDAGWYTGLDNKAIDSQSIWRTIGTWNIDRVKYPNTLKEIDDYVESHGDKLLLWYEPELNLLADSAKFEAQYGFKPNWFLSAGGSTAIQFVNLANEFAYDWLFNTLCNSIRENGVDYFRDDFNNDPAPAWAYGDFKEGEGRTGITQQKYVQNHLRMWRELKEEFPNLLIDSCSSGGRRNDLETMRLAVPLHRSDTDYNSDSMRLSYNSTLFAWLPYFGTPSFLSSTPLEVSQYLMRAAFGGALKLGYAWGGLSAQSYGIVRDTIAEFEQIKPYLYADYYLLTEYADVYTNDAWNAWEFFDPDKDEGYLAFFRRSEAHESSITVQVKGLDPNATYELYDFDGVQGIASVKGSVLMNGLTVTLSEPSMSGLFLLRPAA